jgi:class 3 adenylate cyclase
VWILPETIPDKPAIIGACAVRHKLGDGLAPSGKAKTGYSGHGLLPDGTNRTTLCPHRHSRQVRTGPRFRQQFNREDVQSMSLFAMNRLNSEGDEVEHQFRSHAPLDRFDPTRTNVSPAIRKSISEVSAIEAIVLTVDIRRSSSVLKESIDIAQYAKILDDFVAEFRTVLHYHGGWFDKFTGDGFICYWLVEDPFAEHMDTVLDFCCSVMDNFRSYYYPAFVANMRNEPAGIGLSIGVDAGPCYLTPIVGDLTIIGSPIVGSVRMCDTCPPYHLVLNAYPGSRLVEGMSTTCGRLSDDIAYQVEALSVATKEYPDGQVAYAVEFYRKGQRLFF